MAQSTINTNVSNSPSVDVIHTAAGDAKTNGILHLSGTQIAILFPKGGNATNYLIWSGDYTADQLKAQEWSSYAITASQVWKTTNQTTGFLGHLAYGYGDYSISVYFLCPQGTLYVDSSSYVGSSRFTLAPLL